MKSGELCEVSLAAVTNTTIENSPRKPQWLKRGITVRDGCDMESTDTMQNTLDNSFQLY